MVGALAVGGTMAYLTDSKGATNTFTVGKVQVDLEEPNYPGNGSDEVTNVVPNQVIAKDPKVENTGNNSAVVFVEYSVPVADLITVDDEGHRKESALTEIILEIREKRGWFFALRCEQRQVRDFLLFFLFHAKGKKRAKSGRSTSVFPSTSWTHAGTRSPMKTKKGIDEK